ncbi:MAG: hypothetical protein KAQ93_03655 [Spirochaetales bacterium]|nr:hypothetical protein [Spirochaetales bacterium]
MKSRVVYSIDISTTNHLVMVTAKGIYKLNEIKDLIHTVIKDPEYKPEYNSIIDIRDVKYTLTVSEIFSISDFILSFKHYFKGKTAIIAKGEILINMFKLSTMFISKHGLQTNIFLNYEEAIKWLEDPDSIKLH